MIEKIQKKDFINFLINKNIDCIYSIKQLENFDINHFFYISFEENNLLGYLITLELEHEIEIIYIRTINDFKNRGVGTSLINHLSKKNKDIFLEVNKENINAISLYKKNGFKLINIRKKYFGNNDALIFKK